MPVLYEQEVAEEDLQSALPHPVDEAEPDDDPGADESIAEQRERALGAAKPQEQGERHSNRRQAEKQREEPHPVVVVDGRHQRGCEDGCQREPGVFVRHDRLLIHPGHGVQDRYEGLMLRLSPRRPILDGGGGVSSIA